MKLPCDECDECGWDYQEYGEGKVVGGALVCFHCLGDLYSFCKDCDEYHRKPKKIAPSNPAVEVKTRDIRAVIQQKLKRMTGRLAP